MGFEISRPADNQSSFEYQMNVKLNSLLMLLELTMIILCYMSMDVAGVLRTLGLGLGRCYDIT